MKSLAMLNLNRISPNADFCSEIKALELKLEILNKNVLYVTHMEDKILKMLTKLSTDDGLQKQVDDYFGSDDEHFPEETSPQTDTDEQ